jgi:hypothetical protein
MKVDKIFENQSTLIGFLRKLRNAGVTSVKVEKDGRMEFTLAPKAAPCAREGKGTEVEPAIAESTDRANPVRHIVHGNPTFDNAPVDTPFTPAGPRLSEEELSEEEMLFASSPYGPPPRG